MQGFGESGSLDHEVLDAGSAERLLSHGELGQRTLVSRQGAERGHVEFTVPGSDAIPQPAFDPVELSGVDHRGERRRKAMKGVTA